MLLSGSSLSNLTTMGCRPELVVAFTPASAGRYTATKPGFPRMRQLRTGTDLAYRKIPHFGQGPAATGSEAARPKHQAATAARAAVMNMADDASSHVSSASDARQPVAGPGRSTTRRMAP